jgi:hypothetical protein
VIARCTAVGYRCETRQLGAEEVTRGFWLEQAHADQPAVLTDALHDVSVRLKLRNDGGGERDPVGMQLGERERLVACLAQLRTSSSRHIS